jgi:hypothetical protein
MTHCVRQRTWLPTWFDGSARIQYELVLRYRVIRQHRDGRRNGGAFGVSETVWTRCLAGERFMGETVMAALLHALYRW